MLFIQARGESNKVIHNMILLVGFPQVVEKKHFTDIVIKIAQSYILYDSFCVLREN